MKVQVEILASIIHRQGKCVHEELNRCTFLATYGTFWHLSASPVFTSP